MYNSYSSAYKKQSITTMTPMEIVVKLYSEAEKQLSRAVIFIDKKDYESANKALIKSQDCVNALRSSLDMKIEMSKNLDSLYDYFNRQILTANVKKDTAIINALLPQLRELREAFEQISVMPREQLKQAANL